MMQRKTFDDDYGRHALVLRPGADGPAFGRIDVVQLGARACSPSVMPKDYVPRHAKEDRLPEWTINNPGYIK